MSVGPKAQIYTHTKCFFSLPYQVLADLALCLDAFLPCLPTPSLGKTAGRRRRGRQRMRWLDGISDATDVSFQ